jgi:sulfite reductase (NADPH) flavoprotein alpha-component
MLPQPGGGTKFELQYANPYTGALLGKPRGEEFFRQVLELHRKLLWGERGRALTGAAALALLLMAASGIYLRWPRPGQRHQWLLWHLQGKAGRTWLAELHSVAATWLLPFYLLAAASGLYWSYDSYHSVVRSLLASPLVGASKMEASKSGKNDLDTVWRNFSSQVPAWQKIIMLLPSQPGKPLQILYLATDAPHPYANSKIYFDSVSGQVLRHERYADQANGERVLESVFALHAGMYFGSAGRLLMTLASAALPLFALTGWLMYWQRRKPAARLSAQAMPAETETEAETA